MRRLKTIDEIYDEVKDYGLVITNDVVLESALNSRIDRPHIGPLAITPRHMAAQLGESILGRPFVSDLRLVSEVSQETGLGFRQVYSEIQNIREIRRHREDVKGYLSGGSARKILKSYSAMPTIEKALAEFSPDDERVRWFFDRPGGVAVVGLDFFNDLDKHCVPLEYADVGIFTDGVYEIETIHRIGNDRMLADNAAALIDPEHATDFAIVIDTQSPIADTVRSALYRRKIPFVNAMEVRDLAQIRDFLSFVSLALSYRTVRVKDVKEIFANYNGFFDRGREEYLLSKQDPEYLKPHARILRDVMETISGGGMTFGKVAEEICDKLSAPQVLMILDELEVTDAMVDGARVSEIKFAIDNMPDLKHSEQIPDYERKGVLIADCRNSVFVDRPVVIYLGMDSDWEVPVVGRKYLDAEAEMELNAHRLEALVQQGQRRIYCVNSGKNGRPTVPCAGFGVVEGAPAGSFEAICGDVMDGAWSRPVSVPRTVKGEMAPEAEGRPSDDGLKDGFFEQFSKSTFDAYVACPRKLMYKLLLPSSDNTKTQFGSLIHAFAELYACYPEVVKEKGIEYFVEAVGKRYSGLSSPAMESLDRDGIRLAMENVAKYLDALGVRAELDVQNEVKKHPNFLMEQLELERSSSSCEGEQVSASHKIHGDFDLIWNGSVVDYKTGRAKSLEEIRKGMNLDDPPEYPEFQPLIYLALAVANPDTEFEFNQFYVMSDDVKSAKGDYDIRKSVRRIALHPGDVYDVLSLDVTAERLRNQVRKDMKPHAEAVIDAVVRNRPGKAVWRNDGRLMDAVKSIEGLEKDDDAGYMVDELQEIVDAEMADTGDCLYVPAETLKDFLEKLDEMYEDAVKGFRNELPGKPAKNTKCSNCEFFPACTVAGGEVDDAERPGRFPEGHRRDAGRHGRRRRRPRHREDPHHRAEVHQPHLQRESRAEGRPAPHLHQERGGGDGGEDRPRAVRDWRRIGRRDSARADL